MPNLNLRFERHGQGPAVVVLHGLFGSRRNWRSICRQLSQWFTAFSVDLRNHGDSPHAWEMTYRELAGDLELFINAEVKCSAHVLGHSMGGKVAMQLALNRPESVRSLVIVDISPGAYPRRHDNILEALMRLDPGAFHTRAEIEAALAHSIPDVATRRFLLQNLAHQPGGGFRWRLGLREIHAGYAELSGAISGPAPYRGPVLFLKGQHSEYLAESDLPLIRRQFPRAELQVVPDAGHWVQVENPSALLRLTTEFLRSHGDGIQN